MAKLGEQANGAIVTPSSHLPDHGTDRCWEILWHQGYSFKVITGVKT